MLIDMKESIQNATPEKNGFYWRQGDGEVLGPAAKMGLRLLSLEGKRRITFLPSGEFSHRFSLPECGPRLDFDERPPGDRQIGKTISAN